MVRITQASCTSKLMMPRMRPANIANAWLYFKPTLRGIGFSFQLAITTPRMNLIGYGTATAQS